MLHVAWRLRDTIAGMEKSVGQVQSVRSGAGEASASAAGTDARSFAASASAPAAAGSACAPVSSGRKTAKQAVTYYGVSAVQTVVEFAVFAITQALGLATGVANGIAVACSGTFNFLMNRNVTFKASSNFMRSVILFVLLYLWNFAFGTWFIGATYAVFGLSQTIGKFITMAMQGVWGFCLCKWVIFK